MKLKVITFYLFLNSEVQLQLIQPIINTARNMIQKRLKTNDLIVEIYVFNHEAG